MQLAKLLEQGRKQQQQNRSEAIACFEECMQKAEAYGDQLLFATAATEFALELIETGQLSLLHKAKGLLLKAASALLNNNSEYLLELAYIFYAKGILEFQQGNFVDGLLSLQSAYRSYGDHRQGLSLTDDALGRYYTAIGDFQNALFHLERSLLYRKEQNLDREQGVSYAHLGQLNLQMEHYEQAKDYFEQSLDIALGESDNYLRLQALMGLSQVAIAQEEWEQASILLSDAVELIQEPLDTLKAAYLYKDTAEALLGYGKVQAAQECLETEVSLRFEQLQDKRGLAVTKHLRGKILTRRLMDGLDALSEETIEVAEEQLLDASIIFEQQGMSQDYARTLYDLSCLYNLCSNTKYSYQYQGKSVRSLELALNVLAQFDSSSTNLSTKIEALLNQFMDRLGA